MEVTSKQEKSKSHQEFKKLLSEDLGNRKFKEGEIANGIISEIGKKFVFVDLGLKSEGAIPIDEFKLAKELDKIKVGQKIEILLEKIENYSGEVVVSREKAILKSRRIPPIMQRFRKSSGAILKYKSRSNEL